MTEETLEVSSESSPPTYAEAPDSSDSPVTRDLMNLLVRLRKQQKMSQEPIAKAIGITQARVSQMENLKGGNVTLEAFLLYAQTIGAEILVVSEKDRKKKR